jgi:hypothetical protein
MPRITLLTHHYWLLFFIAATSFLLAANGCAQAPSIASASVPPIPAGQARVWIYREFIPSESLNMPEVRMNGVYAGYSQLGGAFYRDVLPGQYLITVASWGVDVNQSALAAVVPGQEVFIKVESLRSWSELGERNGATRDTFYARLIPPQIARVEMAQSSYEGGS